MRRLSGPATASPPVLILGMVTEARTYDKEHVDTSLLFCVLCALKLGDFQFGKPLVMMKIFS